LHSSQSIEENLAALDVEVEAAVTGNEQQKAARLKEKKEKMGARRAAVEEIVPITRKLKKSSDILKVYVALHNIHLLEDKGRYVCFILSMLPLIPDTRSFNPLAAAAAAAAIACCPMQ
jgi:hypothetical protein